MDRRVGCSGLSGDVPADHSASMSTELSAAERPEREAMSEAWASLSTLTSVLPEGAPPSFPCRSRL